MEVGNDGFGTYSTRSRTTDGMYASFSNLRIRYKYQQQHVHTLMLIPPGVDLRDSLREFHREMRLLEAGIKVAMWPDGHEEIVKGALSYINADHVQACKNCNQMGNRPSLTGWIWLTHSWNGRILEPMPKARP